jgi:hypothetical protein
MIQSGRLFSSPVADETVRTFSVSYGIKTYLLCLCIIARTSTKIKNRITLAVYPYIRITYIIDYKDSYYDACYRTS